MIINKIKELFYNKKKLKLISIIAIAGAVSVVLVFKGTYIKSVIDGDPGYVKLKEKTATFAYRKTISLKEIEEDMIVDADDDKPKGPITAAQLKGGFDSYTPSQIITADSEDSSNNFNHNNTSNVSNGSGISNNSNKNNNIEDKAETKPDNNNKEEVIVDKSSFTGKDMIISEGDKFEPFETLQLSAKDVDGRNITKKIVIAENDVDIYKPGLYTVKANVQLSNGNILYKEFLVRVEPVKLQLVVNDIEFSKDVLQKRESYTMNFKIDSSKDYIDVATVNINGKMYYPNKTTRRRFLSKEDIYSIQLVANDKPGIEDINFNTITMTDGTVVDINELKTIEVLKDEATIKDMVIENINDSGEVKISFLIKDEDDTINKVKLYVYDEKENVIVEKEVEKNKIINSILNVNKNGVYKIKIIADEKIEFVSQNTKESKRRELYSTSIEIKNARFSDDSIKEANVEIASYIIYNDEEDFINGLFLRKAISKYELQSGNDGEQGTVDTDQTPTGPGQPDGSGDGTGAGDSAGAGDSGSGDGTGDAGDDTDPDSPSNGDNQEQNKDKFIENKEANNKRGYTTSDKLHVVIPTKGEMKANAGKAPEKRISITIPTTAAFTVKNDSNFISTSIKVSNNGEIPVDISVYNFMDNDGDRGIKLVADRAVTESDERNKINLWLENVVENRRVYLGNGELYSQLGHKITEDQEEQKKIAKVLSGSNSEIRICGEAGKAVLTKDDPILNKFILVLKIKKSYEN